MAIRQKCPKWVYDRRKETMNAEVISESEPFCEEGRMPSSIVLRKKGHGAEFVTHVKVYQGENTKPSFVWGHYYQRIDAAAKDFTDRCKKYDVSERVGE